MAKSIEKRRNLTEMIFSALLLYVFSTIVTMGLMNGFIQFKAQVAGTTQDHLQIFNIELKAKVKSHQMPEQVMNLSH